MIKFFKGNIAALLTVFFVILYLIPINGRLLWQPDETRYAEISREMLQRGDWIVPRLLDIRYFEKPVAGYWINNISQWLFGENNFAVGFGSVFSTGLSALLVFWLATLLWGNRATATLATLIYFTSLLVFSVGSYAVLDPMISLWLTAAMVSFYFTLRAEKTWQKLAAYALLGMTCAMGVMTKGFLALVVPVIAVLPIVMMQRRVKELLLFGWIAVLTAILFCLPWALIIAQREPDFWHYFFWIEHIQRFAADDAQHREPFWYYLPILCLGVLPWLGLLPGALLKGWRERITRPELFFLLSWVLMPLIFFSVAKGKLLTYILPCMAPLSLLMAAYATDCVKGMRPQMLKINGVINLILGLICGLAILILSIGLFPQWVILTKQETYKAILAIVAFAAWGGMGWWSMKAHGQHWQWAAACPLLFALLVGFIIPQKIIDAKQPQNFIHHHISLLNQSRYVLADEVGIANGLAWELKRSDVMMFSTKGELNYGLRYADNSDRYVDNADFPQWLIQARRQGSVSLVLLLSRHGEIPAYLPVASRIERMNRLVLLWYAKTS